MTPEMINHAMLRNNLRQFHGSETFTKWNPLAPQHLLTEGTHYLAEAAQAYWLMDAIASHQTSAKVRGEDFQVWTLRQIGSTFGKAWALVVHDGNGNELDGQLIEFSDFPLDSVKLFAGRNDRGGVTIMLPSEY